MKTIKGDLIMSKDMTFKESLKVEGNILGKDGYKYNLSVNGDINAWNINARNIKARNSKIDAWNIDAEDINAWNINAGNIDAGNIDAEDINAWNIDAEDINAEDINAGNIDAWNIDAEDIKYYAVCFAYQTISCKSIKGERINSKHFCLDGEITIRKDKSKEVKK